MNGLDRRLARMERRIADLEAENTSLRQAIRNMFRTATVGEYDAATDRATVTDEAEGDDDNGVPQTPNVRVIGQAGSVKKRTTLSKGEQVLVLSPGGDFGEPSLLLPLGPNEKNTSPSDHGKEDLTTVGDTAFRLREDVAEVTSARVELGEPGGPKVARVGDFVLVKFGSSAGLHQIVTGASRTYAV